VVYQCVGQAVKCNQRSLHAEGLLPPGMDTVVSSQAKGAAAWLMPGHLQGSGGRCST